MPLERGELGKYASLLSKKLVKPLESLRDSINELSEGNFDQGVKAQKGIEW